MNPEQLPLDPSRVRVIFALPFDPVTLYALEKLLSRNKGNVKSFLTLGQVGKIYNQSQSISMGLAWELLSSTQSPDPFRYVRVGHYLENSKKVPPQPYYPAWKYDVTLPIYEGIWNRWIYASLRMLAMQNPKLMFFAFQKADNTPKYTDPIEQSCCTGRPFAFVDHFTLISIDLES